MNIDPEFSVDAMKQDFLELRKRFTEALQRNRNDLLFTNRLAARIQDELDQKLGHEIKA